MSSVCSGFPIEIVPYDKRWPELFQKEKERIKVALGKACSAVYHIGSTAVPGLCAKPTIDIIIETEDLCAFPKEKLEALGYEYIGELGIPFRLFFHKIYQGKRPYLLHVFQKGDAQIERNLVFRDFLKKHPKACEAYAILKKKLAQEYKHSGNSLYTKGKTEFIKTCLEKAGFNKPIITEAFSEEEKISYAALQEHYYKMNPLKKACEEKETEDHFHFILSEGKEVLAAMHVSWNEQAKIYFVEAKKESAKNAILKFLEKWIAYKKCLEKMKR